MATTRRRRPGYGLQDLRRMLGRWVGYWHQIGALPRPAIWSRGYWRWTEEQVEQIRAMRHLLPRQASGWVSRGELARHLGAAARSVTDAVRKGILPPPTCGREDAKMLFWAREQLPELRRLWAARPRKLQVPSGYLTLRDVAELLGRPRVTLQVWQQRGKFPRAGWSVGGRRYFRVEDLPHLREVHDRLMGVK